MLIRNLYPLFPGIDHGRFTINYQANDLWVSVPEKDIRITLIFSSKMFSVYAKPIRLNDEKASIAREKGLEYENKILKRENIELANLKSAVPQFLAVLHIITDGHY